MTRTLQQRLDGIRTAFEGKAPPEAVEIMHRATQALTDSGQADRALGVGDRAPEFDLKDSMGRNIRSGEMLERGPLVLTFFRGHW
jgi:hypothetical protein